MSRKIALFPGTFDPMTIGHKDIVQRALPLFDEIHIGIGRNTSKSSLFPIEQRINWIREIFRETSSISVASYEGLTVDHCRSVGAGFIIRGLRNMSDFDYEKNIAQMNKLVHPDVETVFLMCDPAYTPISSSIVRDLIINGADASKYLPKEIKYTTDR
jgi:pantetheine-phosphate adenylyltransferase